MSSGLTLYAVGRNVRGVGIGKAASILVNLRFNKKVCANACKLFPACLIFGPSKHKDAMNAQLIAELLAAYMLALLAKNEKAAAHFAARIAEEDAKASNA